MGYSAIEEEKEENINDFFMPFLLSIFCRTHMA
jgi:hypothetical protein